MSSMNTTIKSVAKGIRNELRNAKGKNYKESIWSLNQMIGGAFDNPH